MKRFTEATAELKHLEGDLELEIAALRGSYAEQIAHYKAEQQAVAECLQCYAQDNYSTLFAKARATTCGTEPLAFDKVIHRCSRVEAPPGHSYCNASKSYECPLYVRKKSPTSRPLLLLVETNPYAAALQAGRLCRTTGDLLLRRSLDDTNTVSQ